MGQAQHIQPLGAGILGNFVRGSRPSLQISPTIITNTHTQILHSQVLKNPQVLKHQVPTRTQAPINIQVPTSNPKYLQADPQEMSLHVKDSCHPLLCGILMCQYSMTKAIVRYR